MSLDLSDAKRAVAFLFTGSVSNQSDAVGTCFFGTVTESASAIEYRYLITARHVLDDLRSSGQAAYVRVNMLGGGVAYLPISVHEDEWLVHADDAVDLAIHRWVSEDSENHEIGYLNLNGVVANFGRSTFFREGETVAFTGLMPNFAGEMTNLLALRVGTLALVTDELIAGERGTNPANYHVIDAQSYPGNSGAPVWLVVARSFDLIGVLVAGLPTKAALAMRSEPTRHREEYYNLGMTLVTPVERIADILNCQEEKRRRGG